MKSSQWRIFTVFRLGEGLAHGLFDYFTIHLQRSRTGFGTLFQKFLHVRGVGIDGRQPVQPVAALEKFRTESDVGDVNIPGLSRQFRPRHACHLMHIDG